MKIDMQNYVSRRRSCRLCGSHDLVLALPILPSPIADAFVGRDKKNQQQPSIPLDLYLCEDCGHVQNLDIVNPELLFRDYIFHTSHSAGLVEHFRQYARDVGVEFLFSPGSLVVEIGSNDGTLLHFFKEQNMRVQGVDPALAIAQNASQSGIPTIPEFFTSELATNISTTQGQATLVVANNVFAHADNLSDIVKGIAELLDQDGVFIFEVSYLLDIIDRFVFDTVYHEHLSYHSIEPLKRFFLLHGLHLFDVRRNKSKGGSIRGFVQRVGGPYKENIVIQEMIKNENERGLRQLKIFQDYERQILNRKAAVLTFIDSVRNKGKSIIGYGASTTATTLMYHFELDDKLSFLVDDNSMKHGLFSPGCHLEVKPSSALYEEQPDVVLILAWQYADPILEKHGRFILNGGQFIIPLPQLKVV